MADSFKLGAPLVLSVCQTLLSSGGHFHNGILLLLFYLRHMTCMKSGGGALLGLILAEKLWAHFTTVLILHNSKLLTKVSAQFKAHIQKSLAMARPRLSYAGSSTAECHFTEMLTLCTPVVLSGSQTLLSIHAPPLEAVHLSSSRPFVFIDENNYNRSTS